MLSIILKIINNIKSKLILIILRFDNKTFENIYKKAIFKYYNDINHTPNTEQLEIINYLKDNPANLFSYEFTKKYSEVDIIVYTDDKKKLKYVLLEDKKLYFKRNCSEKQIKELFSTLLLVQDIKSPHRYLTNDFNISKDDIVADIGSAEGDFSLGIIEKVKKVYLFESDPELIEALQATFEPWKEKIIIINKYVSNKITETSTTLDSFFKDKESPSFLKIDVEGAEHSLLCGTKQLLSSKRLTKVVIASYHRYNDEIILRDELEKYDFKTEYSKGYMLSIWDGVLKKPYLRRGLIRATKS